jgi:hypothetical protein
MSKTLLVTAGVNAEPVSHPEYQLEPTLLRSNTMHAAQYRHAQEMQRERLRQAEAQRLRRAAWRARRGLAARLMR